MLISLHKQATTTPKIRAAIQASMDPAWMVAERYGISEQTVWKWRSRDDVHDRSHTPHRLHTTLTPPQEAVAVALRKALLLPLDDLLAVVREFLNPRVSRSGLDRCLRRHGVGNLQALKVGPWVGLTPSRNQSGERDVSGGITKAGDVNLRRALCQAATVMMHRGRSTWLRTWAAQVARRRGSRRAMVALARRIGVILHRMWVEDADFRADGPAPKVV